MQTQHNYTTQHNKLRTCAFHKLTPVVDRTIVVEVERMQQRQAGKPTQARTSHSAPTSTQNTRKQV